MVTMFMQLAPWKSRCVFMNWFNSGIGSLLTLTCEAISILKWSYIYAYLNFQVVTLIFWCSLLLFFSIIMFILTLLIKVFNYMVISWEIFFFLSVQVFFVVVVILSAETVTIYICAVCWLYLSCYMSKTCSCYFSCNVPV